jgi:hypothetical protein
LILVLKKQHLKQPAARPANQKCRGEADGKKQWTKNLPISVYFTLTLDCRTCGQSNRKWLQCAPWNIARMLLPYGIDFAMLLPNWGRGEFGAVH